MGGSLGGKVPTAIFRSFSFWKIPIVQIRMTQLLRNLTLVSTWNSSFLSHTLLCPLTVLGRLRHFQDKALVSTQRRSPGVFT